MKTRLIIFLFAIVAIYPSCSDEDFEDIPTQFTEINTRSNVYNVPNYSDSELIVQYFPGTTDSTKNALRKYHGVFSFEACKLCPDESIELWSFGGPILIEPRKNVMESFGGLMDVDYEFDFTSELGEIIPGSPSDVSFYPNVKPTNTGITIAVLDTGLDHFFPFCYEADGETRKPLLYNASLTKEDTEVSGWDFVDNDENAFDEYTGKHGTAVSFIIDQILNDSDIPHQFLPIRVCDHEGATDYFTLVCGLNYAISRADVVQMSLGWYDDGFGDYGNTIFKNIIDTNGDVLVVTSAGNDSINNEEDVHYPSSYESINLVAVGSTNIAGDSIAGFSNYGINSVDFLAQGEAVPFYDYANVLLLDSLIGTSFAAPQIAGIGAIYMYENPSFSISDIINLIDANGFSTEGYDGFVKYDKYYPLMVD